ncbi:MAG: FAD-binding oxidoreductase, partial [Saprospiraceae bacterium]|nr:FAD-binding oxidoreductase [Saprospiraceae bacterium]
RELIDFAGRHGTSLIPRTAGTSLAGQCVGDGIVVDLSRHFTAILEVNQEEKWVRVQPGVIRDELNRYLRPYGLFFGPNTSTSNRAMIGGMVGNNSCGSTSIVYGSTRDHALEIKALLSDGSPAHFRALSAAELEEKLRENTLEGRLYRQVIEALQPPDVQERIRQRFPKPSIHRRNTGYALDELIDCAPFNAAGPELNLCRLLCGSEGTLAVVTEIKLGLDPLPPPAELVVAAHFDTVRESLQATLLAMEHRPDACELMDKVLLD